MRLRSQRDLVIDVVSSLAAVPEPDWAALVGETDASFFYSPDCLRALEQAPLQPELSPRYLTVRACGDGRLVAGLPVYAQRWQDPLRVLAELVPEGGEGSRILITHLWHCYDSALPSRSLDQEVVDLVWATLEELARQEGAVAFGIFNLAPGPLLERLSAAGRRCHPLLDRYRLDLRGFGTVEDYLATLRHNARLNLRKYRRRAEEAGVQVVLERPPLTGLDEVEALCRTSAARHGSDGYYPAATFGRFLALAGPDVRVLKVVLDGRLLAVSVCFLDRQRFHTWAGGAIYGATPAWSPNYVLFYEELRAAIESGRPWLEAGRRNDEFKLRHGLRPTPLFACVGRP